MLLAFLHDIKAVEAVADNLSHVTESFARLESSGNFLACSLEILFGESFVESLDGETDAAFVAVDLDDAGFDFLAEGEFVFDLLNAILADLGDVNQTVDLVGELDESAERGDLGDLAGNDVADLVEIVDVRPGILFDLLETEGDALLLRIDVENDGFDFIADFEHFVRVVDLAGPGHIGDVDHAVDIVFDFDECAVAGHVADFAFDAASGRILLSEDFPRIAGLLTETEGDLLAFLVDVENDSFDFFANADDIAGLGDALGPGHFGDVDQTFDALFDFNERAVGHDVDDATLDGGTDRVLGLDFVPRIFGLLLETEGDALLVVVDVEDHHFDFLSDFEHFARVGDTSPGHVGDVEEAVDAAEVDERAEVGDVLHDALADLVDFHIFKQLRAAILAGSLEEFAAGNDDVSALLIDLEDLELVFFADEIVHILDRTDIDLGTGEERLDAVEIDDDAAFDAVLHQTGDYAAFAIFAGDFVPGLDEVRLLEADSGHAVLVFNFFEIDIHLVADLDIRPVAEFRGGDETFRLVADVYESAVVSLLDDFSRDDGILDEFVLLLICEQSVHGDVVCAEIDVAFDLFRCGCCCCAHFFLVFLLVYDFFRTMHSRRLHEGIKMAIYS